MLNYKGYVVPKEFDLVYEENDVITSKEEINSIKQQLKKSKHAHLYVRLEHLRSYRVLYRKWRV